MAAYLIWTMTSVRARQYVSAVAPKIRIIASRAADAPVMYRAEAYEDGDDFRERLWTCEHEHETVEDALRCGEDWLETSERRRAGST